MNNHLIDQLCSRTGDSDTPFIRTTGGEITSYKEFLSTTARVANVLKDIGVKPGDRVAAQIPKCLNGLALYIGTVRAGGVYLPLNTAYTANELEYFLGDATPAVFVCDSSQRDMLEPMATGLQCRVFDLSGDDSGSLTDAMSSAPAAFDDVARMPDDLAAILYTSGTTGRAKGAMLSHGNLASNAETLQKIWHFNDTDVLLHALPIYHTHGLFVAINVVMMAGASVLLVPHFNAREIIDLLPDATTMMGVPTHYTRLLSEEAFDADCTRNIRLFISGSAPLLPDTHRAFKERTGQAILERYGMTETSMNTSNPYQGERRAGTVGLPLPDVEVRVTDEKSGDPCPDGTVGMLEVRGPNVFRGYWQMPEKTFSEFREDGWFITGDLGVIDADGYISIVGRDKDLIITGGLNVYPREIEETIDAIYGVNESAVIGVPHPDFGEGVTAVVVAMHGSGITESTIMDAVSAGLAKFKQPKKIIFLDELPRNTMGKVQKNRLRETYSELYTQKT